VTGTRHCKLPLGDVRTLLTPIREAMPQRSVDLDQLSAHGSETPAARGRTCFVAPQYICSGSTSPLGPTKRPQASPAATVRVSLRVGCPGRRSAYWYLPGGRSSIGPFGDCGPPAPAAILMVCLLIVSDASFGPILPSISLACPALGMMSALAAACGFRCTRLTVVSSLARPSFSMAGPSGEVNASSARSAVTVAPSVFSCQP